MSKHLTNIFESIELVRSEVTFNPNDSTNSRIIIINKIYKVKAIFHEQSNFT